MYSAGLWLPCSCGLKSALPVADVACRSGGSVRQAIVEKLPRSRKTVDPLKRRRGDPLFRLLDRLPPVAAATAADVAARHDDYLYGETDGEGPT